MRQLITYTILIFSTAIFITCKNGSNQVAPVVISIWSQCQGLPNNLPVTGFASGGNTLVAGTYNKVASLAYIYFSVDDGSSWALDTMFHTKNHATFSHLIVATPITFLTVGAYLFAGIAEGDSGHVYISTNNGITWVEKDTNFVENVYCFSAICQTVFAGTLHGVFKSTDGGISWTSVNNGLIYPVTGEGYPVRGLATIGSNIFACTFGEGIFRSTNSGSTWSKVDTTDYGFQGLATVGTTVFAGAWAGGQGLSTGGVFASTDNGLSWSHSDSGLGADHAVNVIHSDGHNLFVGTNSSLFLSGDAGRTWSNISVGTPIDSLGVETIAVFNLQLFVSPGYGAWHYQF